MVIQILVNAQAKKSKRVVKKELVAMLQPIRFLASTIMQMLSFVLKAP